MGYTLRVTEPAKPDTSGRMQWMRLIWAMYSVFFFIEPVLRRSASYWAWFALAYVVFLALYLGTHFLCGWKKGAAIIGMFALGLIYVPFNAGASGIFVYAVAALPFWVESERYTLMAMVGGSVAILVEAWLLHITPYSWGTAIFFSWVVGAANIAAANQCRADRKLRLAHEEIERLAKLAERERISRDMHDVLGHTLSVIVLKSELAGRLLDRDLRRTAQEVADIEEIARKALSEVRETIRGYRSEGLEAEIERAKRTLDAAGVSLICDSRPPALGPAEETIVSLVVREATTNIVRHAQASHCHLDFLHARDLTSIVVKDDGRGGFREEGNGLRGMRERIESIGGVFRLDTSAGTQLTIELPSQLAAVAES